MEYTLKNGETVNVRLPKPDDAEAIIDVFKLADKETKFLARNPDEFKVSIERERTLIENILSDTAERVWYLPEYKGKVVGQCSVGTVRNNERYLHRAFVAFVLLKEYWSLGIGTAMMEECLTWCKAHGIEQAELDVLTENKRAIGLYEKYGFKIIGTMPHSLKYLDGTYGDEYLMVKQI